MEVHNTVEDTVITRVNEIFEAFDKGENTGKFCTCKQCRMDVICYTLNRIPSHYIISNRGAARVHRETIDRQQQAADIVALIHDGLKRVNHNQRPNCFQVAGPDKPDQEPGTAVFNIPTIMGRLFNGANFSPLSDVDAELLRDGEMVPMKDGNWQNPCHIVCNTEGNFSFWPAGVIAPKANEYRVFEYSLRLSAPDFDTLVYFFKIPVSSEIRASDSFNLSRTFILPDLYMFPPGEAEKNDDLD